MAFLDEQGVARLWQHVVAKTGESGNKIYIQPDEPADAPIGSVWYDTDEETEVSILPIEQGGTGATTAKAAQFNLMSGLVDESASNFTDANPIVLTYLSPDEERGVCFTRPTLKLWEYIKEKSEPVLLSSGAITVEGGNSVTVSGAYNFYVITGYPSVNKSDAVSITIPKVALPTGTKNYQLADNEYYITFSITGSESEGWTIKAVTTNTSYPGRVFRIIGIN